MTGQGKLCHQCNHRPAVTDRSRCARCLEQRKPVDRRRDREIAEALFPLAVREQVLTMLADGASMNDVHAALGVQQQRIHSFRAHDPQWGVLVDAALMDGRDESLTHGRYSTYRFHSCRCPECRATKKSSKPQGQITRQRSGLVRGRLPRQGRETAAASGKNDAPDVAPTARELYHAYQATRARKESLPFLALLEQGETVKGALEEVKRNQYWLASTRRRVPEFEKQLREAYEKGAYERRRRRAALAPAPSSAEQRAAHLVVAAVASGKSLTEACKAAGANGGWVVRTYRKNEEFRQALTAAAAMHKQVDLKTWLKRNASKNQFIPKPIPPWEDSVR